LRDKVGGELGLAVLVVKPVKQLQVNDLSCVSEDLGGKGLADLGHRGHRDVWVHLDVNQLWLGYPEDEDLCYLMLMLLKSHLSVEGNLEHSVLGPVSDSELQLLRSNRSTGLGNGDVAGIHFSVEQQVLGGQDL